MMKIGAVILAGGQSRRMGQDKAQLKIENTRFLDKIAGELKDFDELLVSVDDPTRHPEINLPMVGDRFPDCGPMCGIYSALSACRSDAMLVLPCDLPLFRTELGGWLVAQYAPEYDAIVPVTGDRIHPLCAVYSKSCLPSLGECLENKKLKLLPLLKSLKTKYIQVTDPQFIRILQCNINTASEYEALLKAEISK